MFVIHPEDAADWQHAMFILSHYRGLYHALFSDAEEASSAYMVVSGTPPGFIFEWSEEGMDTKTAENLHLAEMAFQMNWNQQGGLRCIHCDALPEALREETCGHLVFNKIINPAF